MSLSLTTPVTGAAQTDFTSPTYTLTESRAVDSNGRLYVVSAIGGTQTGVTVNSVGAPFTLNIWIPKVFKTITASVATLVGFSKLVPKNEWVVKTTKAVEVNALQGSSQAEIVTYIRIPVGAFTTSSGLANIRAMHSLHLGALMQSPAQWADGEAAGIL